MTATADKTKATESRKLNQVGSRGLFELRKVISQESKLHFQLEH
jgi:hypothetical protein